MSHSLSETWTDRELAQHFASALRECRKFLEIDAGSSDAAVRYQPSNLIAMIDNQMSKMDIRLEPGTCFCGGAPIDATGLCATCRDERDENAFLREDARRP